MANKSHHVVPAGAKGGWNVKRGGSERASSHHDTKQEAVNAAREISRNQQTEHVIHNQNGQILQKDSHGKDPYPPKG